jgi:allantoin racemase
MDKILVLHPMVQGVEKYKKFFADQTDIEVKGLSEGPDIIRTRADQALAGIDSVKKVMEAEKDGYKAIVLTCHGDPNLFSLRETVRVPLLGPMQTAIHFCSLLSGQFSIMTTNEVYTKHSKQDLIARYGFGPKIASIRPVPFPIPLFEVGMASMQRPVPERIFEPAFKECIKVIKEDGAEAITFGCGAFLWMASELEKELKKQGFEVLTINPVPFTVEVARLLVKIRLSHSALAYPLVSAATPVKA